MKKIFAAITLIVTLSSPALAGWIDQTGSPCIPGAPNCRYVDPPEDPSTQSAISIGDIEYALASVIIATIN